MSTEDMAPAELSQAQRDRIEKNRQKALVIKHSKLVTHPYAKSASNTAVSVEKNIIKVGATKYKDTGGGFLLEQKPDGLPDDLEINYADFEAPMIEEDRPTCENCEKKFANSWLYDVFDCKVCDECKDPEVHTLITKTEAVKEYLLKDCDLEKRDPPLKFIRRKNPHNVRWGEMKLYLQIQVEQRALEVWGSEEKIEEELEKRKEQQVMAKAKKYDKKMKELRMSMRSSLFDKTSAASHTHEYGDETYNEENDDYTHTCTTCGFEETFEKM